MVMMDSSAEEEYRMIGKREFPENECVSLESIFTDVADAKRESA